MFSPRAEQLTALQRLSMELAERIAEVAKEEGRESTTPARRPTTDHLMDSASPVPLQAPSAEPTPLPTQSNSASLAAHSKTAMNTSAANTSVPLRGTRTSALREQKKREQRAIEEREKAARLEAIRAALKVPHRDGSTRRVVASVGNAAAPTAASRSRSASISRPTTTASRAASPIQQSAVAVHVSAPEVPAGINSSCNLMKDEQPHEDGTIIARPKPFDASVTKVPLEFGVAPPIPPKYNANKSVVRSQSPTPTAPPSKQLQEFINYKAVMEAAVLRMRSQLEAQASELHAAKEAARRHDSSESAWRLERKALKEHALKEKANAQSLTVAIDQQNSQLTDALTRLKQSLDAKDGQLRDMSSARDGLAIALEAAEREVAQLRAQKERFGKQYDQTQTILRQLQQNAVLGMQAVSAVASSRPDGSLHRVASGTPTSITKLVAPESAGVGKPSLLDNALITLKDQQYDSLVGHYYPKPTRQCMTQTEVTALHGFRSSVCRDGLSGTSVAVQTTPIFISDTNNTLPLSPLSAALAAKASITSRSTAATEIVIESLRSEIATLHQAVSNATASERRASEQSLIHRNEIERSLRAEKTATEALAACEQLLSEERDRFEEEERRLKSAVSHLDKSLRGEQRKSSDLASKPSDAVTIEMQASRIAEMEVEIKALLQDSEESAARYASSKEDNARLMKQLREAVEHLSEAGDRERDRVLASSLSALPPPSDPFVNSSGSPLYTGAGEYGYPLSDPSPLDQFSFRPFEDNALAPDATLASHYHSSPAARPPLASHTISEAEEPYSSTLKKKKSRKQSDTGSLLGSEASSGIYGEEAVKEKKIKKDKRDKKVKQGSEGVNAQTSGEGMDLASPDGRQFEAWLQQGSTFKLESVE